MKATRSGAGLLDLFLPSGCVACGDWIPGGTALVCGLCRSRLHVPAFPRCPRCHNPRGSGRTDAPDCIECRSWPAALTTARYAYSLEGPADDLVHALKYEGWMEVADFMARVMARSVDGRGGGSHPALVVPVPTTPERARERGYNQAGLIAVRLADLIGLDLGEALDRRPGARSQTSLSPAARRRNVEGAFSLTAGSGRVRGARVLLVDDVLTTGATASAAAEALSAGGAEAVTLVTFARALPRRRRRAA